MRSSTAVTFTECTFDGAELTNSLHRRSAFLNCSFVRVGLRGVTWDGCKMTGSTFWECRTQPMSINGGDWSYVSLGKANLRGLDHDRCPVGLKPISPAPTSPVPGSAMPTCAGRAPAASVLAQADLRGARLDGFDPRTADLRGAHGTSGTRSRSASRSVVVLD